MVNPTQEKLTHLHLDPCALPALKIRTIAHYIHYIRKGNFMKDDAKKNILSLGFFFHRPQLQL